MSNRPMQHPDISEQRLTDLEVKAAYTEDLLDKLDQVIIRQQNQIDQLIREVTQLREQLPDGQGEGHNRAQRNLRDDLPPHF
jgi:SlyX protein